MSESSRSYLKVQYDVRPSKQIERRMLIDAFQLMSEEGFKIRKYTYVGMGSIHFYDFAILHRFFGVNSMISVEIHKDIEKRIHFNNPYSGCIKAKVGVEIGEIIQKLERDKQYFVWLDYDNTLSQEMLEDITQSASILAEGSLLLVTVDTEKPKSIDPSRIDLPATNEETQDYYFEIGANYDHVLAKYKDPSRFDEKVLVDINIDLISAAFNQGVNGRDLTFMPIFNFVYADGHRMLTIGGIIVGSKSRRKLEKSDLKDTVYSRFSFKNEPYFIRVPKITRKERLYLDSAMPCDDTWSPSEFEIRHEDIQSYREIYRFYPAYTEMLV